MNRVKVYRSRSGHTWVLWCPCCRELAYRLFLRRELALAAALVHIRTHHQEDQP